MKIEGGTKKILIGLGMLISFGLVFALYPANAGGGSKFFFELLLGGLFLVGSGSYQAIHVKEEFPDDENIKAFRMLLIRMTSPDYKISKTDGGDFLKVLDFRSDLKEIKSIQESLDQNFEAIHHSYFYSDDEKVDIDEKYRIIVLSQLEKALSVINNHVSRVSK